MEREWERQQRVEAARARIEQRLALVEQIVHTIQQRRAEQVQLLRLGNHRRRHGTASSAIF